MAIKNLDDAKRNKKDEFYTQLEDIQKEVKNYKEHFKDKVVYCNCDDPFESNFFKFFALKFNEYGLKKLISTCYATSPVRFNELDLFTGNEDCFSDLDKRGYKIVIDRENFKETNITEDKIFYYLQTINKPKLLKGDGDFRSEECIEILKSADIVVTNPPFSLFRDYVAQLVEYNKKFIIIGHNNAISYKEIFPLIKDNKIWLGYGFKGGAGFFINTHYEDYASASSHKEGCIRVSGVNWFTNLDHNKRHEDLILVEHYDAERYPKYDNYDAINVDKTADIPCDYFEPMGVPITFLDKYNPEQFEILGMAKTRALTDLHLKELFNSSRKYDPLINGRALYARVIIRRK